MQLCLLRAICMARCQTTSQEAAKICKEASFARNTALVRLHWEAHSSTLDPRDSVMGKHEPATCFVDRALGNCQRSI